jgi:hypothetical protein
MNDLRSSNDISADLPGTEQVGWTNPLASGPPGFEPSPSSPGRVRPDPSALMVQIAAVAGGSLTMIAAVAAAAARWGTISVTWRLVMLAAVLAAVTTAAEYLASTRIRTVSRVLIHLCAYLVLPTAITATAQVGYSWRECIIVGGLLGGVAVALQGNRKSAPLLTASTAPAAVVVAVGVAALSGAPIAVLVAALAGGALVLGWERRATALAAVAIATPIIGVLTQFQIGSGTLREIGATGEHLRVASMVAGLIAGSVFAVIAVRRRSHFHALGVAIAALSVLPGVADFANLDQRDPLTILSAVLILVTLALAGAAVWFSDAHWLAHAAAVLAPFSVLTTMLAASADRLSIITTLGVLGVVAFGVGVIIHPRMSFLTSGGAVSVGLAIITVCVGDQYSPDVRVCATVLGLIVGEIAIRMMIGQLRPGLRELWFLPALIVGALHVFATTIGASPQRLGWTIGIGIAVMIGGLVAEHRVALGAGMVQCCAAVIAASDERLRALPTWVWAMVGGLVLLGAAGAVEYRRSGRSLEPAARQNTPD